MKRTFIRRFQSISTVAIFLSHSAFAGLGEIEVSGKNGINGVHGYSQSGSASSGYSGGNGSNGATGEDAGPATSGQDSGNINVKLSTPQQGVLMLNAIYKPAGQTVTKAFNSGSIEIGKNSYFILRAKGGHGGDGGDGGNGQNGGDGGRGSDATQYSTGDNGGNGGNGGDGGAATSGAEAGKGGKITIDLRDKDTALLMLVQTEFDGGKGGRAGTHGRPGSGGSGGSGGSSYSWTTEESYSESSTDSDGNTTTQTKSTTHYHSNSGGSSGYSGSQGHRSTKSLNNGQDGEDGSLEINVVTESGEIKTYRQRYDLKLVDYTISPEDNDGVLEPGERVSAHDLIVKNTGGMPTPAHTKIRIFLRNSEYSVAESVELEIPKSLAVGESFNFQKESLHFVIKNNIFSTALEERTRWSDHIQPLAEMREVDREFKDFSHPREVEISYPIEIQPITTARALAPGEQAKILLKIKNISKRDFGTASDLRRELSLFVRKTSGDLSTDNFQFTDESGKPWDMQNGILKAIENLKAGESALIEGTLSISPSAESFLKAEIGFRLDLGTPSGDIKKTSVQDRHVGFSVSQVYRKDPKADVLIVVNQDTGKDQIKAFQALAKDMGLHPAVWDVSYYGEMALTKILEQGTSLAQDFKGMSLIIANNNFAVNSGKTSATQLISHTQLAEASALLGISTLILGGDQNSIAENMKLMTVSSTPEINVTKWRLWGAPKRKAFDSRAVRTLKTLNSNDPDGNFVVVHEFSPQVLKSGPLGIGKIWSLGNLQLFKSLDKRDAAIVTVEAGKNGKLNAEDIYSRSSEMALALSLPIEKRVQILNQKMKTGSKEDLYVGQVISESILLSVAEEQSAIRRLKWNFSPTDSNIESRMGRLGDLVRASESLSRDKISVEAQQLWMGLILGLRNMSNESKKWWELLVPFRTDRVASSIMDREIAKLEARVFPTRPWYRSTRENEFHKNDIKLIRTEAKATTVISIGEIKQLKPENPSRLFTKNEYNSKVQQPLVRSEMTISGNVQEIKKDSSSFKTGNSAVICRQALK